MKKRFACLMAAIMLVMNPIEAFAGVYAESDCVDHITQDAVFSVLKEDKYKGMDKDYPWILISLIETESRGNARVISSTGDYGLCQIHCSIHQLRMEKLGVTDILDRKQNIRVAVDILYDLDSMFDGWHNILMHYNGLVSASGYSVYSKQIVDRFEEIKSDVEKKEEKRKLQRFVKKYKVKACCAGGTKEVLKAVAGSTKYYEKRSVQKI